MAARFEWDPRKAASNFRGHGVSFEEATRVFFDPLARIFDDENHAIEEQREIIIGHSNTGTTAAGLIPQREDAVRIISARQGDRT